jgi:hypothetical protein
MRRYSQEEEQRIRIQRLVQRWTNSGLLDATQGETLGAGLRVDLKRTNVFLRVALALFTVLIIGAGVLLVLNFFLVNDQKTMSAVAGGSAIVCIGIAEFLVAIYRCYRFGVEEILAVAAGVLLAIAGYLFTASLLPPGHWLPTVIGFATASGAGLALFRRFGYVYAAIGGTLCAAAIPFQFLLPAAAQRTLAVAVLGIVFLIARAKRRHYRDDYPGDEYGDIQAAALSGAYFALNVQVFSGIYRVDGVFYWCTYALTWIVPAAGLFLGIRERDRELMDVSLVLAIVTLVTSKPYLGWPRNTWDPIVFGIVLIAIATAARRWLASGPGGERHGFTAAPILDSDRAALSLLGTASALAPAGVLPGAATPCADPSPQFGGGRSGGAGSSDTF